MNARTRLIPSALPVATSLLAILMAFVAGGLFLELRGKDALNAYQILFSRGIGNADGLTETLKKMAPFLIVSAGLLISLKAGVWNIGIDGQLRFGGLMAAIVAPQLVGAVPRAAMIAVVAIVGFAGGLAWAVVPAVLRVRFGLNEIISTLMMNYVALNFTSWLVKGPVKDPEGVAPQTKQVPFDWLLPNIPGTKVHIGLIAGMVVVVLVAVLFRSTVLGFMLQTLGRNPQAAVHAGLPVGRLTALALLLSGGFAGLAGASDVLSVQQGLFSASWNADYGFPAFSLVYLARLSSIALVPFAFFFAFLVTGGAVMPQRAQIPTYYIGMLEGLMLIFFAVAVFLERQLLPRLSGRPQVVDEPAGQPLPAGTAGEPVALLTGQGESR